MTTTVPGRTAARTADENRAPGRNMPRGFLAEVAEGLAGAIASAPELAAVALLVWTLRSSDQLVCTVLGHLAGIALAKSRAMFRHVALLAWTAFAVVEVAIAGAFIDPVWQNAWLYLAPYAATALACAWSGRRRDLWPYAVAWVAGTLMTALTIRHDLPSALGFSLVWQFNLAAPWVFLALGRRKLLKPALVVACGAALVHPLVVAATLSPSWFEFLITYGTKLLAWLGAAAVVGAAARAARDGVSENGGDELVVAMQRRPWLAVAALALISLATGGLEVGLRVSDFDFWVSRIVEVAADSALVCAVVSVGPGIYEKCAPLLAACAAATLSWIRLSRLRTASGRFAAGGRWHEILVAAVFLVPVVVAGVLATNPRRFVLAALATILAATVVASYFAQFDDTRWTLTGVAVAALVPTALIAAARNVRPSWHMIVNATLLSVLLRVLLCLPWFPTSRGPSWISLPFAGFHAGVCAVLARRCLSMTAVPLDHPSMTDFPRGTAQ